jgi:chemotaxis family two-component system response regulator Rcp1
MADLEQERFILVIDPNATHAQTIQQVLGRYRLQTLTDGQAALDYLQQSSSDQLPRPDLILLDPDLPGAKGQDVLAVIKADPRLKRIPVIVFASSDRAEDVFNTYAAQGNCYVVKAKDPEELTLIVQRIEAFWLEIVTLPLQ